MTCVKMGSDESDFNVSLIEGQSHKTVSTNLGGVNADRFYIALFSALEQTDCPLGSCDSIQVHFTLRPQKRDGLLGTGAGGGGGGETKE